MGEEYDEYDDDEFHLTDPRDPMTGKHPDYFDPLEEPDDPRWQLDVEYVSKKESKINDSKPNIDNNSSNGNINNKEPIEVRGGRDEDAIDEVNYISEREEISGDIPTDVIIEENMNNRTSELEELLREDWVPVENAELETEEWKPDENAELEIEEWKPDENAELKNEEWKPDENAELKNEEWKPDENAELKNEEWVPIEEPPIDDKNFQQTQPYHEEKMSPKHIEETSKNYNISFDHIFETDIEDIVNDIEKAEGLHALYTEVQISSSSDKEAAEQYYMDKMKEEGVIITNDIYFETEKGGELRNEIRADEASEVTSNFGEKFTEINGKMQVVNEIGTDTAENMINSNKIKHNEESVDNKDSKTDMKNELPKVKELDTPHGSSSGQYTTQIIKQEEEELSEQILHEINEEKHDKSLENLNQEKKIENKDIKEITENQVISKKEKETSRGASEKEVSKNKSVDQEIEREVKEENLGNDALLKEEWEKTLVEWIKTKRLKAYLPKKKKS